MARQLEELDCSPATMRLGELLIARGLIAEGDLERALEIQGEVGGRIGSILVRIGAISENQLLPALGEQLGVRSFTAEELPQDVLELAEWLSRQPIDLRWWAGRKVLCWPLDDGVACAAHDPLDPTISEPLESAFADVTIHWGLVRAHDLDKLLEQLRRLETRDEGASDRLREMAEEAPTIELVSNILAQAVDLDASDVHVEPGEVSFDVRFRVDGILKTHFSYEMRRFAPVASRIKLISGMDIAETRLPQDGRVTLRLSGVEMDLRVSTIPGVLGESIVLRLLPKRRQNFSLSALGMLDDHLDQFRTWVRQPHGIVLVTGPTGSGKSTTLYAGLEEINDGKRKLITVEDPVEYQVPGVTQIQAHAQIGYTFARALRAILRHDPDVIMIGEIRDLETAEIAVQAALTGHLVFSTLHTNDAVSAFTRLIDMGVEPFLVASPVIGVQAQRLVRRLCESCAEPWEPPAGTREELAAAGGGDEPDRWRRAVGCEACGDTGYRGRFGIYEFVTVDDAMHRGIVESRSTHELRALAEDQAYRTLRGDGLIKAARGLTSIEEVARVTADA